MRRDPHRRAGAGRTVGTAFLAVLVALAAALLCLPAAAGAAAGPALTVDVAADRHAIAPEIYGMSYADPQLAAELDLPVNRWGGNYTDRYNWRIDTWNTGSDWFFENIAGCWPGCANDPPADPSQGYRRIVDENRATGAQTLLTLPMVGWVAKQAGYEHPLPCSFPRSAHAAQQQWDDDWIPPGASACGNGLEPDGSALTGNDPTIASTPSTAQLSSDWIADITARYGAGAIRFYGLGNEPALWNSTHRDVHPERASYDEILAKSTALALAAKRADPHGKTLGLSEWGWPNYFCSAADGAPEQFCSETVGADKPDRAAHGGQPLVTWFLDRMRAEGDRHGCRLLDYLDLHYYAQGGWDTGVTRSLWDRSYTDPSWIGERIALLPRMRDWVVGHYPGTRIALSEYDLSLGGDDPTTEQQILDTLIQADTLGILARERVDLAARWSPPDADDLEANAFRIFRDYDGAGARFGETWVRSLSGDQGALSVYGATRDADGALTIVLVNKSSQPLSSPLALPGVGPRTAESYRWQATTPHRRPARAEDVTVAGGAATVTVPARSLTLVEVPAAVAPDSGVAPAGPGPAAACGGDPGPGPGPDPDPDPVDPGQRTPTPPGDGSGPTPTPVPTPPAGTPAPLPPTRSQPPLPLADRVGLPPANRCVRRARLKFRVRSPTRRRLLSARVTLGRRTLTLTGRKLTRPVVLRGLPRRGSFTVTVRFRLAGERTSAVAHRRYRRCG